jgi:haloalkane dehalogenase
MKIAQRMLLLGVFLLFFAAQVSAQDQSEPITYHGIDFPELPYPSRWVDVNGDKMHYLEGGDPAADPILFIHGNPTWSYLWRNIMPIVEPKGRVIAVDLIGFGRSDKPDIGYRIADHQRYLDGFIEAMDLKNITLVVHDWGSTLGLNYAAAHPDNVKAIVLMEALIPPGTLTPLDELPQIYQDIFGPLRTEGVGEELVLNQNFFVETILAQDMQFSGEALDPYRAPFPNPEDRRPILVFPREIPFGGEPADVAAMVENYSNWLSETETPVLLFYATPGFIVTESVVAWAEEHIHHLETIDLGPGVHFLQELYPEAIGEGIVNWLERLPE